MILAQPETGVVKVQKGLLDSGSDYNFLNKFNVRKARLLLLSRCNQEFVTFNRDKFKTENAYDLDISVTNDHGETRTFRQRFYGYKGTRYHMVLSMEFLKAKGARYYD